MEITRTLVARAVSGVLLTAGLAAPTMLAGPARAANAACGTATASVTTPAAAAVDCDITGTLAVTSGGLTATPPTALSWSKTLDGTDAEVVDATAAHQQIEVDDLTGSLAGWHVTAAATTFSTADSSHSLGDTGTLKVNGSTSDNTATTAPTGGCVTAAACTVPTSQATYPVAVTTAGSPSPVTIYSAAASTGIGKVKLSGIGWWVHVPVDTFAATYTSTITLSVVSAP